MMDKIDRQINTILSRIDWNLVGQCISSEKDSKNRNIDEITASEKEKLIKRLRFIAVTKMDELVCDYWIIKYNKKRRNGSTLLYAIFRNIWSWQQRKTSN